YQLALDRSVLQLVVQRWPESLGFSHRFTHCCQLAWLSIERSNRLEKDGSVQSSPGQGCSDGTFLAVNAGTFRIPAVRLTWAGTKNAFPSGEKERVAKTCGRGRIVDRRVDPHGISGSSPFRRIGPAPKKRALRQDS